MLSIGNHSKYLVTFKLFFLTVCQYLLSLFFPYFNGHEVRVLPFEMVLYCECVVIVTVSFSLAGYCAYLDVENALDPSLAESIGVNTENLLISQPDSAENLLSVVDTLTKSGSVDVIVVDSVRILLLSLA